MFCPSYTLVKVFGICNFFGFYSTPNRCIFLDS